MDEGEMIPEEDMMMLYFTALNSPANGPLIFNLQSLEASNPFSSTITLEGGMLPDSRGRPSAATQQTLDDSSTSSSTSSLLLSLIVVSTITVLSFAGILVLRKHSEEAAGAKVVSGRELSGSQSSSSRRRSSADEEETEIVFQRAGVSGSDDDSLYTDEGSLFEQSFR